MNRAATPYRTTPELYTQLGVNINNSRLNYAVRRVKVIMMMIIITKRIMICFMVLVVIIIIMAVTILIIQ